MMNYKFFKTIDKLKNQLYITSIDLTDINSEVREKNPYGIDENNDSYEDKDFWDNLLLEFDKLYPLIYKFERRVYMIIYKEEIVSVKEFLDADSLEEDLDKIYKYLQNYKGSIDTRTKCLEKAAHRFSYVLEIIERVEDRLGISAIPTHNLQLKTNLNNKQLDVLYELLVNGGFIPESTDKNGFKWALGARYDDYANFKIDWLKHKNLAVYLIEKLCNEGNNIPQPNYLSIGSRIFGIRNMSQIKDGYKNNDLGCPLKAKPIDEILNTIKGVK